MKTKEELIELMPYETAYRAYTGISFDPEKRAVSTRESFANSIISLYETLKNLDETRIEEIEKDIEDVTEKLLKKEIAWLNAKSRTISPMITGPARFPTRRNEKALNSEHNRATEYLEYAEKVKTALIRKYKIVKKIYAEDVIEEYRPKTKNSLFKESLYRKLINIAKDNRIEEVEKALENATDIFTSRHKIHRELEALKIKQTAESKEEEVNGVKIVDNIQENRIQLYFDGKPDKDTITYLKSKCWKWTPSKSCWQNWRNAQRLIETKEYLNRI